MNGKGQLSKPGAANGVLSWHESQTEIGPINPTTPHPSGCEPKRDEDLFPEVQNGRSEHSPREHTKIALPIAHLVGPDSQKLTDSNS